MPIDQRPYSFQQLASLRLPELMAQMRRKWLKRSLWKSLPERGVGEKSMAKELGISGDFPGCYVLIENDVPLYVGIFVGCLSDFASMSLGKLISMPRSSYRMASHAVGHELTPVGGHAASRGQG